MSGVSALFAQMAEILGDRMGVPMVEVARIAGQFAKPRTTHMRALDEAVLPAYRGDIVNGIAFDAAARSPDPQRDGSGAHMQSVDTAASLLGGARERRADLHQP